MRMRILDLSAVLLSRTGVLKRPFVVEKLVNQLEHKYNNESSFAVHADIIISTRPRLISHATPV